MTDELMYHQAFPARFLEAAMLMGKQVLVTIEGARIQRLEGEKGEKDTLVLKFAGKEKEFVCNKTNGFCMKTMFGPSISKWIGKRIVIFPTKAEFGKKMVDAIRILGSPDISEDIPVSARIGRKQFRHTLKAVRAGQQAVTSTPTTPTEQPSEDGQYDFSKVDIDPEANHLPDAYEDPLYGAPELAGELVP
jgi:hypothetical protein